MAKENDVCSQQDEGSRSAREVKRDSGGTFVAKENYVCSQTNGGSWDKYNGYRPRIHAAAHHPAIRCG